MILRFLKWLWSWVFFLFIGWCRIYKVGGIRKSVFQRRNERGEFVKLRQGRVRYLFDGEELLGEKMIILIHGFATSINYFSLKTELSKKLVEKGFCVLSVDLFGHGYSATPNVDKYDRYFFASQIIELLKKLEIDPSIPKVLCGWSLGGTVALTVASEYHKEMNLQGIVLFAPSGYEKGHGFGKFLSRLPKCCAYVFLYFLFKNMYFSSKKKNKMKADRIFELTEREFCFQRDHNPGFFRALARITISFQERDLTEMLKKIPGEEVKTLLLFGDGDKNFDEDYAPKKIEKFKMGLGDGVTVKKLEGHDHYSLIFDDLVFEDIIQFLENNMEE